MGPSEEALTRGLDLVLTETSKGRCLAELVEPTGKVLYSREYKNIGSARASVSLWMKRHLGAQEVRATKRPAARPLGPATSQMVEFLDARADDNELRAVAMRQEAEELEREAKRIRAAVDVLRESDGL